MRIEEIEDSRRLELLINGVLDYAIYTIDLEGNIVSWNSGAERLKGYRKRDRRRGYRVRQSHTRHDRANAGAATPARSPGTARYISAHGSVGQLSGGIARDFNNQLMIVLGNLETAEQVAKGLSGAALPRL